jgi:hypothetical protein
VEATFNCIKALVFPDAVLEPCQVRAATEGTDARAEVSVQLSENGKTVRSKGADPDTLVASANAYRGAEQADGQAAAREAGGDDGAVWGPVDRWRLFQLRWPDLSGPPGYSGCAEISESP